MISALPTAQRNISPLIDRETQVLIVGAGPTGLVLALWLTRQGIRVRIIDKAAEPGNHIAGHRRPGAHSRVLSPTRYRR
jgi:2-polyprenyl-6-methoxyphenol hydroxylase-like FAD-dependent oxidoreductase